MGESIQCWQCGTRMTLDELASNDGDCPRCEVEVHLAEYLDNALSKVATLEAENAKLRAELEQRAADGSRLDADDVRAACQNAIEVFADEENAEQCREVAEYMREVLLADLDRASAPSAPKADDPVKVQLLEALEALSKSAPSACCVDFHHRPCDYHGADKPCPALDRYEVARLAARAAFAAARKGEWKV